MQFWAESWAGCEKRVSWRIQMQFFGKSTKARSSHGRSSVTSGVLDCLSRYPRTRSCRNLLSPIDSISYLMDWVWFFNMGSFRGRRLLKYQLNLTKWFSARIACISGNATSKSYRSIRKSTSLTSFESNVRGKIHADLPMPHAHHHLIVNLPATQDPEVEKKM